jgi:competence protein ComEC
VARFDVAGNQVVQVRGKTALATLDGCGGGAILVTNVALEAPRPCDAYDPIRLRDTGSLALYPDTLGGLRIESARDHSGDRIWHPDTAHDPGLLRHLLRWSDRSQKRAPEASAGGQ